MTRTMLNEAVPSGRMTTRPRHTLDPLFHPAVVAVVDSGDDPTGAAGAYLQSLLSRPFVGEVYGVGPTPLSIRGVRQYRRVGDVPEPIDLAILTGRAASVPELVGECMDAGVKAAVIAATGIWAGSPVGAELERWIEIEVRQGGMRVVGPNSFGLMCPYAGLNATPSALTPRPGSVAFLSQSAGLCNAILDWSLRERVGLSALVSVGSMVDVGWGDLIDYLGHDPETRSIVIYMETLDDPASFVEAASRVALTKPIIVLKAGRASTPAKAAAHRAAPFGDDDVLDCVFSRCGLLRVRRLSDLFAMAEVLGRQARPRGPRLAVLTNSGGPGTIAADALIETGGKLARLAPETVAALDGLLPEHWSHTNPIDVLDDADPDRFAQAAELVVADPGVDGLLVILTPNAQADPTCTASRIRRLAAGEKPILASWMGGVGVLAGTELLNRAGISTFSHPDTAARAFRYMWKFSRNLERLCDALAVEQQAARTMTETPDLTPIARSLRVTGRPTLDDAEARAILAAYDLPTLPTFAHDVEEAVRLSSEIGYPVALKPLTKVTPRATARLVRRDLVDEAALRHAYRAIEAATAAEFGPGSFLGVSVWPIVDPHGYELAVSSRVDAHFGPVLMFGLGGPLASVYRDHALSLPPLSKERARQMIDETRIAAALRGEAGTPPANLAELEQFLVRFSRLVIEQRWIKQIEIDPLIASGDRLMALDVRIEAWDPTIPEDERARPVMLG